MGQPAFIGGSMLHRAIQRVVNKVKSVLRLDLTYTDNTFRIVTLLEALSHMGKHH